MELPSTHTTQPHTTLPNQPPVSSSLSPPTHASSSASLSQRDVKAEQVVPRLDTSHGNKPISHSSHSSSGQSNNKFRCRVAMACVHCRHRKIRCDGAQPSCYTCTRLQRKCEYERVSEQDNLLSRERKRLSRERKAARLAASASQGLSLIHI